MWERNLELQLEWSTRIEQPSKRIVPYVAPTWAWASVDGTIEYGIRLFGVGSITSRCFFTVHGKQVTHASSDDIFGSVIAARLTLRCELFHYGHSRSETPKRRRVFGKLEIGLQTVMCRIWLDDDNPGLIENSCSAFLLSTRLWVQDSGYSHISGLVLESTGIQGEYRRLGIFFYRRVCLVKEAMLLGDNLAGPNTPQHFTVVTKGKDGG